MYVFFNWALLMLRSYRFSRPFIEQCVVKNDVIWEANVSPLALDLQGWGWFSVHIKGSPSRYTRVFRAIFWPTWMGGKAEPDWVGVRTFISKEHNLLTIAAPCGETLDIRFVNIFNPWDFFGLSRLLFNVPTHSADLGTVHIEPSPQEALSVEAMGDLMPPPSQHYYRNDLTAIRKLVHEQCLSFPDIYLPEGVIDKRSFFPVVTGVKFEERFKEVIKKEEVRVDE